MIDDITVVSDIFMNAVKEKRCIFFIGNGGSASDCMHLASEFVGRFRLTRGALSAISLTSDSSAITAIGNDFGYEYVFGTFFVKLSIKK